VKKTKSKENPKIGILGFGREGKSLLRFLTASSLWQGSEIWVLDKKIDAKMQINAHDAKKVKWQLGKNYLKNLSEFEIIFRSPGIPYLSKEIQRAKRHGTVISSATKLFFSLVPREKIIGITGSKGKGTTSTLLAHILENAGCKTILAGNIGKPMLDIVSRARRADYVVLELSSFQLHDLTVSPHTAVMLDIFPEHLDHHRTIAEYLNAKMNLGRFQKKADAIFYFADNSQSRAIAKKSPARKFPVYPTEKNPRKNFEMAKAVAQFLNIPAATIKKTIVSFRGLEHRLEFVRTIRPYSTVLKNSGISFWNDSAATNPTATAAAVKTFRNPIFLIAGGKDKGLDYTILARAIRTSRHVKLVVLYGENKTEMAREIRKFNVRIKIRTTTHLTAALTVAFDASKDIVGSHSPVTILFSPASASFDQFKNYSERGAQFKKAVRTLH